MGAVPCGTCLTPFVPQWCNGTDFRNLRVGHAHAEKGGGVLSRRFTVRLGLGDEDLIAAILSHPAGRRSAMIREALRAWFCGPEALQHLLQVVAAQGALGAPDSTPPAGLRRELVDDFLDDFLGGR